MVQKKKTGILPLDPFKVACQAVLVLLPPRLPLIGPQIVSFDVDFPKTSRDFSSVSVKLKNNWESSLQDKWVKWFTA